MGILDQKPADSESHRRAVLRASIAKMAKECGLGDYEGRNWRGFHHHASLCIAAYGFLLLERLAGHKKKSSNSRRLAYPPPGASGPRRKQRHLPDSIATCRDELVQAIAAALPRCPCCGQAPGESGYL